MHLFLRGFCLLLALASAAASQAYEKGDWIIRTGPTNVDPDTDSDAFDIAGLAAVEVDVDDAWALGFTATYMVTNNIGVELLAATPFEHDITVDGANIDAGETKHLPPTVTLVWYPRGGKPGWQPFIGAGFNYTYFFDESVDGQLEDALGVITEPITSRTDPIPSNLSLDESWGWAGRVGVDYPFGDNWSATASMWYLDISTEATIRNALGNFKADVDIDPFVYMIGVSYRF